MFRNASNHEHIIVTNLGYGYHSLYVQTFTTPADIKCLNSWDDEDPSPTVDINNVKNKFYRIQSKAVKQSDLNIMDKINTDWNKGEMYEAYPYLTSKEEVESAGRLVWANKPCHPLLSLEFRKVT